MVRIRWNDGLAMAAGTWTQLLRQVNNLPWNADYEKDELKEHLRKRAFVWDLREIQPNLSPKRLFEELEKARMLTIIR